MELLFESMQGPLLILGTRAQSLRFFCEIRNYIAAVVLMS